ncbi:MAG: zinc-binding dehydrogenase [Acidimicrobiia bacterium]
MTSGKNAELVKSLGATEVIDYINTDVASLSNQFDVVLDTVGNIPIKLAKKLLTPNGRAALIVASLWETITARGNIIAGPAPEKKEDIEELLDLVGQEKLKVLIDSRFSLDDIKSAYAQADSGHKVGNILISMT